MSQSPEEQPPSMEELSDRLSLLLQENQQSIAKMGAQLDPAAMLMLRLDSFINFVFQRLGTTSPEVRQLLSLMFELEFQQRLAESLKGVKAEVRKSSLAAVATASPADLKRMWQQQQRNGNGAP